MGNIESAITVLEEHITSIHSVPEWTEKMGYDSNQYSSRKVRNHFGLRPKELIIQKKIAKIVEKFSSSPDEIYYCIAKRLGFVDNNALYKFVKRHTGKSPSELKKEYEKGV